MGRFLLFALIFFLGVRGPLLAGEPQPVAVEVPGGIDQSGYNRLLKKYVNNQGLVDYAAWKNNRDDLAALDRFLRQYAKAGSEAAGNEKAAALTNAYNAFTLQWILQNYPTESIWSLEDSFTAQRHEIGGKKVSLNDIEKGTLIPAIGWKDHAVLVCAARSCPPLRRSAYDAGSFDAQVADAYHRWLDRPDLNEYLPDKNQVEISSIFKWYQGDFAKIGGPRGVLARFGPEKFAQFFRGKNYEVDFKSYNWGLNDQGEHGRHYSRVQLFFDNIF